MDSPSANVCGRLQGREAGRGPLPGDTLEQSFLFCNRVRLLDGGSCCGLRLPSTEGLAWPAPLSRPHRPPTFSRTGGLPLYPRRGLRPLHPGWETEAASFSHLARRDPLPNLPPSTEAGIGGFPRAPGEGTALAESGRAHPLACHGMGRHNWPHFMALIADELGGPEEAIRQMGRSMSSLSASAEKPG